MYQDSSYYKGIVILYEDNHLLVVSKPAGMLSQKDKTGDDSIIEVLKEYIKQKYNKPGNVFLGSVHRLDRPTSGVMVFARTSKALTRLTKALKAKDFKKKYYAILEGRINSKQGELTHYLIKDTKRNYVKAHTNLVVNSKKAVLHYKVVSVEHNLTLADIELMTGRPHQIRSQLSKEFYPILGDTKYGSHTSFSDRNFCLHSYFLELTHPVKNERLIFNTLPDLNNCLWKKFSKKF